MKTAKIPENRAQFLKDRKKFIGASEAPVIMNGKHFDRTRHSLWAEKIGFGVEIKDNPAMQRGRLHEEPARILYEQMTDSVMAPCIVFHPTISYMRVSLDGLSSDQLMSVEIKNPSLENHNLARDGVVPPKYFPQLQHALACTQHAKMHYFSYYTCGDSPPEGVIVDVLRDDAYIEKLTAEEKTFWDMVISLRAPDMINSDYREVASVEWEQKKDEYDSELEIKRASDGRIEKLRAWFIDYCKGQSSRGFGLSVRKVHSKGAVSYKSVPELAGVDLDLFRGAPRDSWTIRSI